MRNFQFFFLGKVCIFLSLILLFSLFTNAPFLGYLYAQNHAYACMDTTLPFEYSGLTHAVYPADESGTVWWVDILSDPSINAPDTIQEIDIYLVFDTPLVKGTQVSLQPGDHPFNQDGKYRWSQSMGSLRDTLYLHGHRPKCEGKPGTGLLVRVSLNHTGVFHGARLIQKIGGIVIAEIAIGMKTCLRCTRKISPNPAWTYINLPTLNCGSAEAFLYDAQGNMVMSQEMHANSHNRLYFPHIHPGMYWLWVKPDQALPRWYSFVKL